MDLAGVSGFVFFVAVLIDGNVYYREKMIWVSTILLSIAIVAMLPSTERFLLKLINKLSDKNRFIRLMQDKLGVLKEINEEREMRKRFWTTLFHSILITVAIAVSVHFVLLSFRTDFTLIQMWYLCNSSNDSDSGDCRYRYSACKVGYCPESSRV
jgi:O-antigen/teichoic acid export membrane protein